MYNIRIVCVFFFCMGVWMGSKEVLCPGKKQVLAERQRYRQGLRHELKGDSVVRSFCIVSDGCEMG